MFQEGHDLVQVLLPEWTNEQMNEWTHFRVNWLIILGSSVKLFGLWTVTRFQMKTESKMQSTIEK